MSRIPALSGSDAPPPGDVTTSSQHGSRYVATGAPDVARWRRPVVLLGVVALVHAVLPILVLGRHWFIGIDESVYLSQINAHVPAGGFSAPRARGSTLIAAPVTVFTDAVAPMRVWTAALSGLGLFLAFRTWLRLRPGYVVPVAAALFASLWTVTYYSFQVMPNEWVAFATVGGCGCLLSYLLDGRQWSLAGAGLAVGVAALFRPSDAVFALAAYVLIALACRTPRRRRMTAVAVLVAGAIAGAADWVIEAHTSYGGVRHRLHVAEAEQGGSGLHWTGGALARTLGGPLLCRQNCHTSSNPVYWLWWPAAALLIALAVVQARRTARPVLLLAPLLLGLALAAQYVFTVPYAAPRFLLPAYAALAVPAAAGLRAVWRRARTGRTRSLLGAALTLAFVANTTVQLHVITARIEPTALRAGREVQGAAALLRRTGLEKPCLVLGASGSNGPLAYRLQCSNVRPDRSGLLADLRHGVHVAWLRTTPPSTSWDYHWRERHVRYFGAPFDVYVGVGPDPRDDGDVDASGGRITRRRPVAPARHRRGVRVSA